MSDGGGGKRRGSENTVFGSATHVRAEGVNGRCQWLIVCLLIYAHRPLY